METDMQLETFLEGQGFQQIMLEKNAVGHLMLTLHYDGNPFNVILDTGASVTLLDMEVAAKLQLAMEKLDIEGGGVGTAQAEVHQLPQREVGVGGFVMQDISLFAMDISHVNQALHNRDAVKIDGVLGSDILVKYSAIIDCKHRCLYLLSN